MKLTSLIAFAAFAAAFFNTTLQAGEKATFEVKVPAMTCVGCAWSVTKQLEKLDHVSDVYVDAKTKTAIIASDSDDAPGKKAIFSAVETAGYKASGYKKLKVKFVEAKAELTGEKG